MNKEIKTEWVAALRSGEYLQGKSALRQLRNSEMQYCCLGVLCDILINKGVGPGGWKETYDTSAIFGVPTGDPEANYAESGVLPDWAMKASGVKNEVGRFSSSESSLATMNDSGLSFERIADIIEREF